MNYLRLVWVLRFALMSISTGSLAQNQPASIPFNFIVFGDMPYVLPADYARFENLIKDVNRQSQVFNVHVGDIKSSETDCSDASYQKIHSYFQQFNKPLIYVPGDNEWTDCNKYSPGKYDEEERLTALRKLFFDGKNSLGKTRMALTSEAQQPGFAKYVENNRWDYGNVSFATVHVVGTNNNFVPNSRNNNEEFYGRNKANLAWLDIVFDSAIQQNQRGVVIFLHADMFNSAKDSKEANAFTDFKDKLRARTVDFKKPVLLVNGDSHVFLVDKPMYQQANLKKPADNFTRLQVFGEYSVHAVKVTIDPASPSLFQIEQVLVEGN